MPPFTDAERQARTRHGLVSNVKDIHRTIVGQQNRAASDLAKIAAAKVRAAALGEYDGEVAAAMFPGNQFDIALPPQAKAHHGRPCDRTDDGRRSTSVASRSNEYISYCFIRVVLP